MASCPACGSAHDEGAAFCPACGRPLTAQAQAAEAQARREAGVRFAGFWKRALAALIDAVVIQVPLWILLRLSGDSFSVTTHHDPRTGDTVTDVHNLAVGVIQIVAGILVEWFYYAMQESSPHQATLGKRALSIVVTDLAGERITFARATGRHFAKWLSALTFCIGYLMAGWTRRKQALHDKVAGTLVVVRDGPPPRR